MARTPFTEIDLTTPTLSTRPSGTRVLIIHRNADVAHGLAMLLRSERGIEVARTAASIPAGAHWARIEQPDVVVLDADLPSMNARWSISYIRDEAPAARFVLLSSGILEPVAPTEFSAGAELVLATYPVETFIQAVRRAAFRGSPATRFSPRAA